MYSLNDRLKFGKYEGHTIKEVFCGQKYTTQKFINDFLEFKLKDLTFDNVIVRNVEVLMNNKMFFEIDLKTDNIKYTKGKQDAIDWIIYHLCLDDSKLGSEVFGSPNDCIDEINKIKSSKHKPSTDAQYINWCIKNLDSFFLNPNDLIGLQYERCYHFYGVDLYTATSYTASISFHYEPIISVTTFKFDDEAVKLNKKKNDEYVAKKKRKPSNYNGHSVDDNSSNFDDLDEPQYSDGYGGSLDNDFINDVLDGDAEAHWNID